MRERDVRTLEGDVEKNRDKRERKRGSLSLRPRDEGSLSEYAVKKDCET